jgi:hypothetical protein
MIILNITKKYDEKSWELLISDFYCWPISLLAFSASMDFARIA